MPRQGWSDIWYLISSQLSEEDQNRPLAKLWLTASSDIFLMVTTYWGWRKVATSRIWNIKSTCWNNTCYLISSGFSEWKSQSCTLYTIQKKHTNFSPNYTLLSSAKQEDIKLTAHSCPHRQLPHTYPLSHTHSGEPTNQDLGEARGLRVQLQREVSSSPSYQLVPW